MMMMVMAAMIMMEKTILYNLSKKAKLRPVLFLVSDLSGTQSTCDVMIMMAIMVVVVVVIIIWNNLNGNAKWRSLLLQVICLEYNLLAL